MPHTRKNRAPVEDTPEEDARDLRTAERYDPSGFATPRGSWDHVQIEREIARLRGLPRGKRA